LLPALSSARKSAKSIACSNNLKQFALIESNYADDYNGWLTFEDSTAQPNDNVWTLKFRTYTGLKNVNYPDTMTKLLICPGFAKNVPNIYNYFTDYGMNARYVSYAQLTKPLIKLHNTKSPSKTMISGDSASSSEVHRGDRLMTGTSDYSTNILMFRHNNGINMAFADGHVSFMKRTELIATTHYGVWENPYRNVLWEPTRSYTYIP
jgi:prepilin-type processing-associated H-X9-DG protein